MLEYQAGDEVEVGIDYTPDFYMVLPDTAEFHKIDLKKEAQNGVGETGAAVEWQSVSCLAELDTNLRHC